jgi:hypothetical protein
MNAITSAILAGCNAPTNEKAHGSPQTAGPKDQLTQHRYPNAKPATQQGSQDEPSTFARLSRQFAAVGLALYPLDGATVLVTAPSLGMSRTLPDLRAAHSYLRQIGGAV